MLSVKNLTKSFGDISVLNGISFELNKGEVLAIIGSSGSGKTTLLRCMNYLEIPDGGEITVAGTEYFSVVTGIPKESEIRERRLHMGLVFQSFNLFPQYTVKANLLLAAKLIEQEKLKRKLDANEIDKTQ
ncbi:MAG: amino acid ABC transporter ATP-binding protein, partial [Clostridia bacterium]|nr:amino acid ABC transporter ATP-binding protein [Clostridia bacterium]